MNPEIYNSIIMFDSKIGDNVFLNNLIVDVDVTISSGFEFGNQSNLDSNPKELKAISEGEKRDWTHRMSQTLAMILAGGIGKRLSILSKLRAKPAVPFGGIYRIIDFTLSNVMNSGI